MRLRAANTGRVLAVISADEARQLWINLATALGLGTNELTVKRVRKASSLKPLAKRSKEAHLFGAGPRALVPIASITSIEQLVGVAEDGSDNRASTCRQDERLSCREPGQATASRLPQFSFVSLPLAAG
jgi:hypothetical protein